VLGDRRVYLVTETGPDGRAELSEIFVSRPPTPDDATQVRADLADLNSRLATARDRHAGNGATGPLLGRYAEALDALRELVAQFARWPTDAGDTPGLRLSPIQLANITGAAIDTLGLASAPLDPLSPAMLSRIRADSPLGYLLARSLGAAQTQRAYFDRLQDAPAGLSLWDILNDYAFAVAGTD
jgi:hypothetical protein